MGILGGATTSGRRNPLLASSAIESTSGGENFPSDRCGAPLSADAGLLSNSEEQAKHVYLDTAIVDGDEIDGQGDPTTNIEGAADGSRMDFHYSAESPFLSHDAECARFISQASFSRTLLLLDSLKRLGNYLSASTHFSRAIGEMNRSYANYEADLRKVRTLREKLENKFEVVRFERVKLAEELGIVKSRKLSLESNFVAEKERCDVFNEEKRDAMEENSRLLGELSSLSTKVYAFKAGADEVKKSSWEAGYSAARLACQNLLSKIQRCLKVVTERVEVYVSLEAARLSLNCLTSHATANLSFVFPMACHLPSKGR